MRYDPPNYNSVSNDCDRFVSAAVGSGWTFEQLIQCVKQCWVEEHQEKLRFAIQDVQKDIKA